MIRVVVNFVPRLDYEREAVARHGQIDKGSAIKVSAAATLTNSKTVAIGLAALAEP